MLLSGMQLSIHTKYSAGGSAEVFVYLISHRHTEHCPKMSDHPRNMHACITEGCDIAAQVKQAQHVQHVAPSVEERECLDYVVNTLELAVSANAASFVDDQCSPLSIAHDLGSGPVYLFLGAAYSLQDCAGNASLCLCFCHSIIVTTTILV